MTDDFDPSLELPEDGGRTPKKAIAVEQDETTHLTTEDSVLNYTQIMREKLLKEMLSKGLPEDPAAQKAILSTLKDMDAAALTKKRIKSDEKTGASLTETAQVLAHLLNQRGNQAVNETVNPIPISDRPAPSLGDEHESPELVEGETVVNAPQRSYDSFQAERSRMRNNVD